MDPKIIHGWQRDDSFATKISWLPGCSKIQPKLYVSYRSYFSPKTVQLVFLLTFECGVCNICVQLDFLFTWHEDKKFKTKYGDQLHMSKRPLILKYEGPSKRKDRRYAKSKENPAMEKKRLFIA